MWNIMGYICSITKPESYRPIAFLSSSSKVSECIILQDLHNHPLNQSYHTVTVQVPSRSFHDLTTGQSSRQSKQELQKSGQHCSNFSGSGKDLWSKCKSFILNVNWRALIVVKTYLRTRPDEFLPCTDSVLNIHQWHSIHT